MKKIFALALTIAFTMIFASCQEEMGSLSNLGENDADKIVITLAMGNPEYGADCKTVTDVDEIHNFIEVFNSGRLGETISDDDIAIGGISSYVFYKNDEIVHTFVFNVNDTEVIWHDDEWHEVTYPEDSPLPFDLYEQSQGEFKIVDHEGNEMDK